MMWSGELEYSLFNPFFAAWTSSRGSSFVTAEGTGGKQGIFFIGGFTQNLSLQEVCWG